MVSGELAPYCNTIPGVCNYPQPGDQGIQGATGATGLSSVPDGAPRRVHVSGGGLEAFCDGIPRECWYASQGAQGPTGPTGESGLPYSPANGPGRRAHVVPAQSFEFGERVVLEGCELPTTGGGSTNMLPFAVALLGVGAVALFTGRRRQRVAG
jgi:hypothetical protein